MKAKNEQSKPPRLFRGARVRMNEFGRERHPRYGDRAGLIVGQGSPSSWRVKFDERRTIQAIHQNYLEQVPEPGNAASDQPGSQAVRHAGVSLRS
jgi:hypothetical protein